LHRYLNSRIRAGGHANEFQRTAARLIEMRSHAYLASGHVIDEAGPRRVE
jgi:hypothetical protein